MNNTVLSCDQLTYRLPQQAGKVSILDSINFSLGVGEMIAITGASGSGKSTLLHCLAGLDSPTSGQVMLQGQDLSRLPEAQRARLRQEHLGFIYQFHHLLPELTVKENIAMPLLIAGMRTSQAMAAADRALGQIALPTAGNKSIGDLSGGERQRVAIARALVHAPSCVLADEPTGHLDAQTAQEMMALMRRLNKESGISFLLVTHDLKLAQQADRQYALQFGQLIEMTP
jgi:lipoprotein-releasing system ATP-binding protein